MKLFLREHIPLTVFHLLHAVLLLSIVYLYMLEQSFHPSFGMFVYLFVISLVCIVMFLTWRYWRQSHAYRFLSSNLRQLDMSTHPFSGSPLLHAFQKLLHSQYRYYTKELQALHKEMDDASLFMNQWVHQMKTPVSVMDLLLQNFDIQDQFDREFVNSMREELERLQHGLELALYSERIKRFSHDFHVKRLPLKTMVNHVIQHYKRSFIRNRIHPIVEIPETIFVETDQKWFQFALSQIVINAIKYSKNVSNQIVLSAVQRENEVFLSVQDFGVGIPKQDIGRVFEPFFTGMNGRRFRESTGMGLYLVKQIVDHLGHGITISAEEGKGTTVTITFYNVTKM
ncbi:HAMP domain-containing histidine kinase [Parageobacillus toebii NBRC 107807]|uniref:histidine kinase n=2 Tax=Anoxybacillaceae TaxID=3120669 RepID=A0A6G9J1M2_9BACL|nr:MULTISPECIES: sensor histidine kinase [Bacillaceae]OQP02364.1 two-component sensor histidine kinase [Geobacillus sp. 44C]PDM39849.1 sensor histidine kinase [Parageobacillus yumthangensis]TXK91792.1 HAMP domain-containing histidine kinase [Parageobacillus sp. SY1]MBB3868911.1 signal transduction histidine kinase [Parageobacillus toebii NBRC 107807]MED4989414.1 sensor histidine kinase [Parageobacillus toebii]